MLQGAEQVMRSVFDNSGPCCVCACQTRGDTFSDATPIVIAASAGPPPAALPALVKAESKVVPLGHYVFTLTLLNNHELRINASSHSGFHASKVIALPEEPKQVRNYVPLFGVFLRIARINQSCYFFFFHFFFRRNTIVAIVPNMNLGHNIQQ
jgi:hypothetical protein